MSKGSEWHLGAVDSLAVAAITAPHLLYAFIWFMPEIWRRFFPKPIRAFQLSASILKGKATSACLSRQTSCDLPGETGMSL